MFDAVVEGLQDILFEMGCTRVRLNDCVPVGVCEAGVVDSEHIHFNTGRQQGNDRMHVLRNAGRSVKCNRCPYVVDVLLRDIMAAQEVARGICGFLQVAVSKAPNTVLVRASRPARASDTALRLLSTDPYVSSLECLPHYGHSGVMLIEHSFSQPWKHFPRVSNGLVR